LWGVHPQGGKKGKTVGFKQTTRVKLVAGFETGNEQ